jgi:hypothetical protein
MQAVKNLDQMIAAQAAKLGALARLRHPFGASIASVAQLVKQVDCVKAWIG